ncbi:MAG: RDD family protein [Vicinamibacteria bacterium]
MVVVYFAGRAARVDLSALIASWRWLGAYLGLLAVFYASYFTGTTGQTPGKLVTGLRVVSASGRPPAYHLAAARAVAGLAGVVAAGLGCLPMAFDPAARAVHDRLFGTRVVRR